jgi:hypothetical protein
MNVTLMNFDVTTHIILPKWLASSAKHWQLCGSNWCMRCFVFKPSVIVPSEFVSHDGTG